MAQVYDLLDVQAVPTVADGNKIANVRSIISGIALTCSEYCVSFIIHEDVCLMP